WTQKMKPELYCQVSNRFPIRIGMLLKASLLERRDRLDEYRPTVGSEASQRSLRRVLWKPGNRAPAPAKLAKRRAMKAPLLIAAALL
ncbi:hypothetical protein ABTE52_21255, partial [Acinetobacter baumannii]